MAFGLDISDLSIEILKLKKRFGKIKFFAANRTNIPTGVFENGLVKKKKELAEAIKKTCEKSTPRPLRDRRVVVSLPESRIFSYIFKFPKKLNCRQIAEILKFEVPNVLPVTPEETYSDFLSLGVLGEEREIFYVACPKKVVDDLKEVIKMAGLEPIAFDIETACLARAVVDKNKNNNGAVIVDIGARGTVIAIFDQSGIRSSITIRAAGNMFTEEIAKKMKIKPDKAEELKRSCGLSVEDKRCREGKVFLILQSLFPPIIAEIKKSIDYYEKKTGRRIGKIVVCGGSRAMPGITDYFRANLGLEVEIGKPYLLDSVVFDKSGIKSLSSLLDVFGLAQRAIDKNPEFSGVNLMFDMERAAKKRGGRGIFKKFLCGMLVASAVFILSYFGIKNFWPGVVFKTISPAQKEIVPLEKNLTEIYFDEVIQAGGDGYFQGRVLEIKEEGEKIFPATGKKTIDSQAKGEVEIFNNSNFSQSLVARTRLLSPEGILFRLKNSATIPAGGSFIAEVYAEESGAAGNIGPTTFTIPGLSPDFQKLIYAESKKAMTGGLEEIIFVSSDDIQKAKIKFSEELILLSKNEQELQFSLDEEVLSPLVLDHEILEIAVDPEEESISSEFKIGLKIKINFLIIKKDFIEEELTVKLKNMTPGDFDKYIFEEINLSPLNFDRDSGLAEISVKARAVRIK